MTVSRHAWIVLAIVAFLSVFAVCMRPRRLFADPTTDQTPKTIAVIGAGLGGLTVAYRLQQAGYNVDVYEARNRPGGRVYTYHADDGSYEEFGGTTLLDGDSSALRSLIEECGLTTVVKTGPIAPWIAKDDGSYEDLAEVASLGEPTEVGGLLKEQAGAAATMSAMPSIDEFIQTAAHGNDACVAVLRALWRSTQGDPVNSTGIAWPALHASYTKVWSVAEQLRKKLVPVYSFEYIKGGNDQLVYRLAEPLKGHTHYKSPVTGVQVDYNGSVVISYRDPERSEEKTASYGCVVCAVPCTLLREGGIRFSFVGFPQQEAASITERFATIAQQPYAAVIKMLFRVQAEVSSVEGNELNSARTTHTVALPYFYSLMPAGELWPNVDGSLLTYYITKPLSKGDGTAFTPEDYAQQIQERFPFLDEVTCVGSVDWANEPYSLGTWRYAGRAPLTDYDVDALYQPIANKLFFAGEHTDRSSGNMASAVRSGERVAKEIQALFPGAA